MGEAAFGEALTSRGAPTWVGAAEVEEEEEEARNHRPLRGFIHFSVITRI